MDRDNLSLSFASLGLMYPERPRFEGTLLPRLHAELAERHTFETMTHDHDGAVLSQEGQQTLTVLRRSLIFDQLAARDINLIKRDFADIVSVVQGRLDIPVFWEPRVVLRALWPVPTSTDGVALMRRSAVTLNDDQLEVLAASEVRGVTLRVSVDDEKLEQAKHVNVELGTYLRDPSQLYIELEQIEHAQIETIARLEQWAQGAYDYFMENVANFADSVAR